MSPQTRWPIENLDKLNNHQAAIVVLDWAFSEIHSHGLAPMYERGDAALNLRVVRASATID
jgi:hypothetical protein